MIYPGTLTLRNRHARIYRHFRRRVVGAPLDAFGRSVGLIADENRDASDGLAALMGILESQLAGAVLLIRCELEGVRRIGRGGGCQQIVSVG